MLNHSKHCLQHVIILWAVLGTGTTHDVFHRVGTFSRQRAQVEHVQNLLSCVNAHAQSSLRLIPSGPVAFLTFSLFSSLLIWCRVRDRRCSGDLGGWSTYAGHQLQVMLGGRGGIECLELRCKHLWECCWPGEVSSGAWLGERRGQGHCSVKSVKKTDSAAVPMFDHQRPGDHLHLGCGLTSASGPSIHPGCCSVTEQLPATTPASS